MTQVSKHKLNNKIYVKIFKLFPQLLGLLSKRGQQQILIDSLLSNSEQIMLAKRIAIAYMLVNGYTYDAISSKLKVSYGTLAKISDSLKKADISFTKALSEISKEDAFRDFLSSIGYKVALGLPPKGANWSSWRRNIENDRKNNTNPLV